MITNYLVCTPGKVGTTTIKETLKNNNKPCKASHDLNNIKDALLMRNTLIIVGIRNPIERNFSNFYKGVEAGPKSDTERNKHFMKKYLYRGPHSNLVFKMSQTEISELFYKQTFHNYLYNWFVEFFNIVKIKDIEFDKIKGYKLYDLPNNNKILLYTLEKLNDNSEEILKILECPKLISSNCSVKTTSLYVKLKNNIIYEKTYMNEMLHNDVIEYFYTPTTINNFYSVAAQKL